ncbi:MAG: cobalamin-binding protein, partial [Candidatus Rokubacteria bacterium]|nr:cobalamin-binding protein [Candidatus Rokubacteria bacterium]
MTALCRSLALALCFLPGIALALTVVDQTGHAVTLPAAPRRIVSLVPGVTEILFAIGAQDALVGVTDFCDYPPDARRKARVGDMLAPNLETLVSLRPDLVVATRSGNREETFDQLKRLGLPVYLVDEPPSIADVLRLVGGLGQLTGRRDAAAALAAGLERRITAVRERVAGRPHPRVLYVLWPEPLIVPGRGSLVSELIASAGGESVTADQGQGYPRMSLEAAVGRAPEVIILARHGAGTGPAAREQWQRLESLPAIRSGRLYAADGDLLHRYGPRVVDGL